MTTKTATEKPEPTAWAVQLGQKVARERAEREAQRKAEAERTKEAQRTPTDVLALRFISVVGAALDAIDAFARAADIQIDGDPANHDSVRLRAFGADRLTLRREDDVLRASFEAQSSSEEVLVDLSDENFSATTTAQRIASTFIRQLAAAAGAV